MTITVRTRGRLPHWSKPGAEYFITFRTAASISPATLAALSVTRFTPDEVRRRIELALDRCDRGTLLCKEAAEDVAKSILYGHGRDYILRTWCVMPNHVHLLLREIDGKCLAWAMQVLKSCTAHKVNKRLGRSGSVWEHEYFDRIVRPGELQAVQRYILQNPNRAKLQNWAWVGSIVADEASALQ